MVTMRTLRSVLDEHALLPDADETVLSRDFRGYLEASMSGDIVVALPREVVVQVALVRTAVVYEPGQVDRKRVIRLDRVLVRDEDIRWLPRNPTELRELRSRQLGQERGKLAQGRRIAK
jgi:hypothetical protein